MSFILSNVSSHYTSSRNISLQDITIEFISRNVYRFEFAYYTTKDPVLARNLEFLRRTYSTKLVQFLKSKDLFNKSCLNFLINEHLKDLDFELLSEMPWDSVISRIANVGHGLERVSLRYFLARSSMKTWDKDIDFVNRLVYHMPNLTIIRLGKFCNDTTLQIISKTCPKLQELNADNADAITNAGLEALCRLRDDLVEPRCVCSDLRILSLDNIHKLEDGIRLVLKNMASLQFLSSDALPVILNKIYKDTCGLHSFRTYDLTELVIYQVYENDSTVAEFLSSVSVLCPNIKTIDVECYYQTEVEALCNFTKLERLTLQPAYAKRCGRMYLNLNHLLQSIGKSLKELHLCSGILSISVLLHNCPNLEYIELERTTFESPVENSGAMLNKLTKLELSFSDYCYNFDHLTMRQIINSCPKIESLYLYEFYFQSVEETYSALLNFCKGSRLCHLTFNDNHVDKNLLESIVTTTSSLETLSVNRCFNLNQEDIDHLKRISNIPIKFSV